MARRDSWVFNPNGGGKPIPELVQQRILEEFAAEAIRLGAEQLEVE